MLSLRERLAGRNVVVTVDSTPVEVIPAPAPKPVRPAVKAKDKLEILFGDWVALVRHHNVHTHGNPSVEITRPIQSRLWEEYNRDCSPFHARDLGKVLPQMG